MIHAETTTKRFTSPLVIIGILFFIFGFVTWLNTVLVPFLQMACELTFFESYFVTFAFYIAYFLFAFPSSRVIDKIGYKRSMSVGLGIMSFGAILFIPAANFCSFPLFLTGLFLLGTGLTLLQTAANPYAAILGSPESAAKRISIMGVCSKTAGMLAPIVLSAFTLQRAAPIQNQIKLCTADPILKETLLCQLAQQCLLPYICIALCLLILSIWIRFSSLPEISLLEKGDCKEAPKSFKIRNYPTLAGGIISIFFYVGAEVISIDTLINYALLEGFSAETAKWFPVLSMFMLLVGYFIGIWGIPKYFSQKKALVASCICGIVLSIPVLFLNASAGLFLLSFLGLANAMIWPSVWGLSVDGLGRHLNIGSSLLIMAIVGGALLPLIYGFIADNMGLRQAYITLPICYAIILIYGTTRKK